MALSDLNKKTMQGFILAFSENHNYHHYTGDVYKAQENVHSIITDKRLPAIPVDTQPNWRIIHNMGVILSKNNIALISISIFLCGLALLSPQLQARTNTIHRGRNSSVDIASLDKWTELNSVKEEVAIESVYPLKSLDDLRNIMFVAVHPYNIMEKFRPKWRQIFKDYNVQFLNRGTPGNGTGIRISLKNIDFTKRNKILIASYFTLHPYHLNERWNFTDNYYKRLSQHEKWQNSTGDVIEDPYEGGGAKDVFGEVLKRENGRRILMSLNNTNWLNYQVKASQYAINAGSNAIAMDLMNIAPFIEKGDFSEWSISEFNRYLESRFTRRELIQMRINDINGFNIQKYIVNAYIKNATVMQHANGDKFFRTEPYNKALDDPLIREFIKFNYHSLIDFHRNLSSRVRDYALDKNMVVPYYGNLIVGHPSFILSGNNNSILLSHISDIIQLETRPAVPPKGRALIAYKIGWAMSEREKPIWSLHQPFYGFPDEPKIDRTESLVGLNQLYLAEAYGAGVIPEVDLGGWPGIKDGTGIFVDKKGDIYHELKTYLDFVKNNLDYFKNVEPYSKIGLVYSVPSFMWRRFPLFGIGWNKERKSFVGYARALEEAHLQYDVLIFGMRGFWDDSEILRELSKYDVLILPKVYSASNEQLRALEGFLRKGGRIVCVGRDIFSKDENYRERNKNIISRILGRRPGQVIFIDEEDAVNFHNNTIEKGRKDVIGFNRLISAPSYNLDKLMETNAPREVGVNVLKQTDRLIFHFINYDYDANSDSFREKKNIEFKLGNRLPIKEINKVTLISPDSEKFLYIDRPKGRSFVMPELIIWNMIVVDARKP